MPNTAPLRGIYDVHPTGGSRRVFKQFSWLKPVPSKWRSLVPPTSGYPLKGAMSHTVGTPLAKYKRVYDRII